MEENKPFASILRQGYTLITRHTKDWSDDLIKRNDAVEGLMIFENFKEEDKGRSRNKIATCDTREHAAAIVSAVNNTYGAGISPESVTAMLNALKAIVDCDECESGWISDACISQAKAAIESAIINP